MLTCGTALHFTMFSAAQYITVPGGHGYSDHEVQIQDGSFRATRKEAEDWISNSKRGYCLYLAEISLETGKWTLSPSKEMIESDEKILAKKKREEEEFDRKCPGGRFIIEMWEERDREAWTEFAKPKIPS